VLTLQEGDRPSGGSRRNEGDQWADHQQHALLAWTAGHVGVNVFFRLWKVADVQLTDFNHREGESLV